MTEDSEIIPGIYFLMTEDSEIIPVIYFLMTEDPEIIPGKCVSMQRIIIPHIQLVLGGGGPNHTSNIF